MRALAFACSVPLFLAAGCLSHERTDPADAGAAVDARSLADTATPDAASVVDVGARADAPRTCGPDDRWVTVGVEPVTSDVANCAPIRIEGADLRAITAVPEEDGVRLHFDFCPTADADCRCDVVLTNVGTETVVRTNCTPDGNGSLSTVVMHLEEGSHWVVRGVNERRPTVSWARKRGVRRGLGARAVLGAHVCRGTRSSHRGGGHGPKSKSCCGGPLAGRMGSR
ncbi:MAG: hypothetical protein ACK5U8_23410 [Deltaproteobacteria bacterium]|jgi:hypothetical protein